MPAASLQHPPDGANAPVAVADHHGGRVVGYLRVSTEEQGASGLGLEAQRSEITAEWLGVAGRSPGSRRTCRAERARPPRPHRRCRGRGERRGRRARSSSKLDRLSRSVAHFSTLLERFRSKGWGLVILDLGIDTTTIMGEAMATMAATFAQVERRLIWQRTKEALAVKKAQGVRLGRPPTMPQSVVRRIQRQRARGDSLARIADELNAAGVPTAQGGARWCAATVRHACFGRRSRQGSRLPLGVVDRSGA